MSQKIGALVKTSLVDFPGRVCATIFLKHCNLRCPYCYNSVLVYGKDEDGFVTIEELTAHLKKRQNVLSGLVISGGEALLHPDLTEIIIIAKSLGYKIKLDTNGTLPEKLNSLINDSSLRPDFIAMDIKTSPSKYHEKLNAGCISDPVIYETSLAQSIKLISSLPANQREFRTVLVPELIHEKEIKEIASLLPEDASWQFAQFKNENCLEPLYNFLKPYSPQEAERLVALAKSLIPGAALR